MQAAAKNPVINAPKLGSACSMSVHSPQTRLAFHWLLNSRGREYRKCIIEEGREEMKSASDTCRRFN